MWTRKNEMEISQKKAFIKYSNCTLTFISFRFSFKTIGNRTTSEKPFTLKVHPIRAKKMVKMRPPSVEGDKSPKPTVQIVTED